MKKEVGLLHLAVMLFGLAGVIGKFVTLPAILIINCCNWNNYFFNFSTFCDFFRTASIS